MINKTLRVVHNGDVDGRLVNLLSASTEQRMIRFFFPG